MKIKLIHEVRAVKTKKELANILAAQRISEQVLADTLKKLRTGVTEIEIYNFIKKQFAKYGAPVLAFTPLVAFGKNSANIHHTIPTKSKLKIGDTIMLDFGTTVNHYCSDMTRTYFWGKASPKQKKLYETVLKAQEIALKKIMSGERRAKIIDSSARNFLAKKYKNNFKHGLGHGIGTVIHEWPNFKPKSEDILPVNSVMTVEPGIYLKGFGGVRIEDMVLITARGGQNLTKVPKTLVNAILQVK
jgi:Xaa-Pro aminopeptidase